MAKYSTPDGTWKSRKAYSAWSRIQLWAKENHDRYVEATPDDPIVAEWRNKRNEAHAIKQANFTPMSIGG